MTEVDITNNYILINGWMLTELELSGTELIIYALIYGFTQDNQTEFSGSLSYMMKWTGKSKRCVQDTIDKLVEKGYITKSTGSINGILYCNYKANGRYSKNCHSIANSAIGYSNNCHTGIANSAIGIAKTATNNTNNNTINNTNDNINNSISLNNEGSYSEDFERFWSMYPRKENKKNAYKIWTKLNVSNELLEKILKFIIYKIKYSEQWQDIKYIPMPTTFLNGKRWEDEVDFNKYSNEYEHNDDNGGFDTL